MATRHWDRFEQIELIALMEANCILPLARAAGVKDISLDPSLVKLPACDLRVVLTWDTDATDIDLHVVEPSGEEVYFEHTRRRDRRPAQRGLHRRLRPGGIPAQEGHARRVPHRREVLRQQFGPPAGRRDRPRRCLHELRPGQREADLAHGSPPPRGREGNGRDGEAVVEGGTT